MNYFNYLFNNIFSWIGCLNLPVVLQAMIFIKMKIMILFTTKKKKKKNCKKVSQLRFVPDLQIYILTFSTLVFALLYNFIFRRFGPIIFLFCFKKLFHKLGFSHKPKYFLVPQAKVFP